MEFNGPMTTNGLRAHGIKGMDYGRVRSESGWGADNFVILTHVGVILPLVVPLLGLLATFL